jgi:hypothetical protein
MKGIGIMDACLECIGLPTLPADPVPAHLQSLGRARLTDGLRRTCFVCTTCGLHWVFYRHTGWRRIPAPGWASESQRAQVEARFPDSV